MVGGGSCMGTLLITKGRRYVQESGTWCARTMRSALREAEYIDHCGRLFRPQYQERGQRGRVNLNGYGMVLRRPQIYPRLT